MGDCSRNSESAELPVATITEKVIAEKDFHPKRGGFVTLPYFRTPTTGTALRNHFFLVNQNQGELGVSFWNQLQM
jgi:hypothetical protein